MKGRKAKRILVCPLDWGLGHATRCIPVIHELLKNKAEVIIAAEGRPLTLLRQEFPSLEFINFPGYRISYPSRIPLWISMPLQSPRILFRIFREHHQLKSIIRNYFIDAVISDNRYGLSSKAVPTVFITHQLTVKVPFPFGFLERVTHAATAFFVRKYTQCWVPDSGGTNNLSGLLAHKYPAARNTEFIGPLSRFKKTITYPPKYTLLVLLSGPEPRRTAFEKRILAQLHDAPFKTLVVRGVPGESTQEISENLHLAGHLPANSLQEAILSSELILSRPGYSTLMDLCTLERKVIFVPTPGQTEQEYLAGRLMQKGQAYCVKEEAMNLKKDMKVAMKYPPLSMHSYSENPEESILRFLETV